MGMFDWSFGSSSDKFDYDDRGGPTSDNASGSGTNGLFGGLFGDGQHYTDYDVSVGGESYTERRYDNGQVYRSDSDGNTERVK